MCVGVAVPWDDLLTHLLARPDVRRRRYRRAASRTEVRFLCRDADRLLPVVIEGELRQLRWGARRGDRSGLPCTGWAWPDSLERDRWSALAPEPAVVPAAFAYGGVWFMVEQGLKAIVVLDPDGCQVTVAPKFTWAAAATGAAGTRS
jgi:hypothetical protein